MHLSLGRIHLETTTALAIIGLAVAPAAHAQQAPQPPQATVDTGEIIVTAQKREQSVQKIGIAITALSGQQLSDLGIHSTDALAHDVPSLQIANIGSQAITTVTIRGVSQNDFSDQNEAPVAIYVDGAYNSFIGGAGANLFDVQRVEVLRGPQGTLFGRNATGGLLQIISNKPTRRPEAYVEMNFGERGLVEVQGALSGPISENLAMRLSYSHKSDNGYVQNADGNSLGGSNNNSVRLQFEYTPSSDLRINLNLHYGHDNVNGATTYYGQRAIIGPGPAHYVAFPTSQAQYVAFCNAEFGANTPVPLVISSTSNCAGFSPPEPGNPYRSNIDDGGFMRRTTYGATLTTTAQLSPHVSAVVIADYLKLNRDVMVDDDATDFRMFNFYSFDRGNQESVEARLQGSDDRLNWVAGLYYLNILHRITTGIDALPNAFTLANANPSTLFPFYTDNSVHQTTESYAGFGQLEYQLSDLVSVIGGGRWSHDTKQIEIYTTCQNSFLPFACGVIAPPGSVQNEGFTSANSNGLNRESSGDWSGKAEIDLHPNPNVLVYASVTRGTKGGGFNASAIAGISQAATPYKPEVLTSYELGFKSHVLPGNITFNAAAFHYDYSNYQAYTLTGLTPTIFNTSATVNGVEGEVRANPWRGLTLGGNATFLNAKAHNVPSNLLGAGVNLGDQNMPQSPKFSAQGLVRYAWTIGDDTLSVQTDGRFVGQRYFNTVNHPALSQGQYAQLDARIAYSFWGGKWEVAVWGKNLTNKAVYATGYDLTTTNGNVAYVVEPPRWFGGTISAHFR